MKKYYFTEQVSNKFKSADDFPEDDLFVSTTLRKQYIKALQDADNFDLQPLEDLHRKYLSKFS